MLGVFTMKISTHFPPAFRQRINEDMSLRKFAVSYIRDKELQLSNIR